MGYRLLAGGCLALSLGVGAGAAFLPTEAASAFTEVTFLNLKLWGACTSAFALMTFSRGDYLRRAWLLLTVSSLMLSEADIFGVALRHSLGLEASIVARSVFATVSNLTQPLAVWTFSRAVRATGLTVAGSATKRTLLTLFVALVAVALVGTSAVAQARGFIGGDLPSGPRLISSLGDILSITLTAPLIYSALTFWGGRLSWVFSFLGASNFCWLLYDGAEAFGDLMEQFGTTFLQNGARAGALLFVVVAGLSQFWVAKGASVQTINR